MGLECGGELVINSLSDSVSISSPEYPESPSHDITCEWIIRGPLDAGLQFVFTNERWASCDINNTYLEVHNGGSDLSSLVSKFCLPQVNPRTLITNNHIAFVRYVLHKQDFHSKFNATIRPDNCNREYFVGGKMNDIQLPMLRKGSQIDFNTRCTIHLRTHSSYYFAVNVTSLYLQGNNCTSGDVIEFRDSENAPFSFNRFCGPRNKTSFDYKLFSLGNELFVSYQRINYQSPPNDTANGRIVGINFSVQTKYRSRAKMK